MANKCKSDCVCHECWSRHQKNGCSFGSPDGMDDYYKDCDCFSFEDAMEISSFDK